MLIRHQPHPFDLSGQEEQLALKLLAFSVLQLAEDDMPHHTLILFAKASMRWPANDWQGSGRHGFSIWLAEEDGLRVITLTHPTGSPL